MAQVELTPRQQEIKKLLKQGKNANAIADALGITTNAVYQQIRRIRASGGSASTGSSRSKANANGKGKAKKSGRQSARKSPVSKPKPKAEPVTAQALLTSEIQAANEAKTEASAAIDSLKGQIAEQETRIEALDAEIVNKGDVLAVLTGEKVAHAKPAPPKPKTPRKPSAAKTAGKQSGKADPAKGGSGQGGGSQAPSNGSSAAATPEPSSQAEREATADHDGGSKDAGAQAPQETPASA